MPEQKALSKRVNLFLNEELVKEAKIFAVNNDTTLTNIIEEALKKFLSKNK
jgi:hypothetical protein